MKAFILGNIFQKINITVNVDLIPNLKTMIGFIYDWLCIACDTFTIALLMHFSKLIDMQYHVLYNRCIQKLRMPRT